MLLAARKRWVLVLLIRSGRLDRKALPVRNDAFSSLFSLWLAAEVEVCMCFHTI